MAIEVRLYADLGRAGDGATEFQVEAKPGLTVKGVIDEAGIRTEDVQMIMVNGQGAGLGHRVTDGDRIALFPAISGG